MVKLFDRCAKAILEGGIYYKVVKTSFTKRFTPKIFFKKVASHSYFFPDHVSIKKKRDIFNCLTY